MVPHDRISLSLGLCPCILPDEDEWILGWQLDGVGVGEWF